MKTIKNCGKLFIENGVIVVKNEQKVFDFNSMMDAIDVLCRFCEINNIDECLNCGVNKAVKANWEKLTKEQKDRCDCPWNGV